MEAGEVLVEALLLFFAEELHDEQDRLVVAWQAAMFLVDCGRR